jgi:hypothetical protein
MVQELARLHRLEARADKVKDKELRHEIFWLRNRLLEFMQIAANMSLNLKDNDEAYMHKMALTSAQEKLSGED